MKITIEIDCGNAAFDEDAGGPGEEVSRILNKAAKRLREHGPHSFGLMDFNGNNVGSVSVEDDEDDDEGEEDDD